MRVILDADALLEAQAAAAYYEDCRPALGHAFLDALEVSLADIAERPDYYFQRREVPRLEDELAEFQLELWQQADQLRESQRRGRWFRNVGRMTCGFCEFSELCLNSIRVNPDVPPGGYEVLPSAHPELSTGGDT